MTPQIIGLLVSSLGGLGLATWALILSARNARIREDLVRSRIEHRELSEDYDAIRHELVVARSTIAKADRRHMEEIESLNAQILECGDDRAVGDIARRGLERLLRSTGGQTSH